MALFGAGAAEIGNAISALNWNGDRRTLCPARDAIGDPAAELSDIWVALYEGLGRPKPWVQPKATAFERLQILVDRVRSGIELVLGGSTHQAKGREWPDVGYITDLTELPPGYGHQLDDRTAADRRKYVALARAQDTVRVRPLSPKLVIKMRWERQA